jgi:ABC-2 type transport system ATP-binding protein
LIGWEGPVQENQLVVEDLTKTFDPGLFKAKVEVLKGLSFEVRRGEIFGFLGPNGAGKTTTIKAITGLIHPDGGSITVCGRPHTHVATRRRIGFMSESPYFYSHLTAAEFLQFHGDLLGIDRARLPTRIEGVLDLVTMRPHAQRPMKTFSKGMLQRMALAQALLGEPDLLILDEPMSGLDPVGRRDVRDIILAQRGLGTTVFFSSHIIPDVETICDRVAIVVDGTVRATEDVRDLLAREAEAYELTFSGVDPDGLKTPLLGVRSGSDAVWAKVAAGERDRLIQELAAGGARLVSLTPVRSTLEEFLMQQYRGGSSS